MRQGQADTIRAALQVMALLLERPMRAAEVAEELGVPLRNVQRLLEAIEGAGIELVRTKTGKEVAISVGKASRKAAASLAERR